MYSQEELMKNREIVLKKEVDLFSLVKNDTSKIALNLGCGKRILPGFLNVDNYIESDSTAECGFVKADIKNLDFLPFPARDLVPMGRYEDFGTIMTSRGCPFNCLFCNSRKFWQQKYRSRSVINIYKELEELVNKYKKKYIFFGDDTFTVDKNKVIKLCKLLIKKKLKLNNVFIG